jgi:hypothetical protein
LTGQSEVIELLEASASRRRAKTVAVAAVVLAAALGGIIGFFGGRIAGLIAAAVLAVPLLLLALSEYRRRVWLADGVVAVRMFGTRRVDLRAAQRIWLLITDVRGSRTVSLLVSGPPDGKAVNIALATFSGTGGRELGLLPLRRLADGLAGNDNVQSLVFSQLLVSELRAEARGAPAPERPLFQLASTAPAGRLAQRLDPDAVTRFVATLD